jgi:hypothetical protein
MAENEGLRSKFCQEISWWMKSAAIFATAGFTSVHTWAEKCNIYEGNNDTNSRLDISNSMTL